MAEEYIALQAHEADNVATVFAEGVVAGTVVTVVNGAGARTNMVVHEDIPFGHKFALRAIEEGEQITKYGEEIGVASRAIAAGTYVHVHNLDSMRGRGDLEVRHD